MFKNKIFVGLMVVTAFIIGIIFFNSTNKKATDQNKIETKKSETKNEITVTSTSEEKTEISPTSKPSSVTDDEIDTKIKELDLDANKVNDSFNDTAVDVMGE